MDTELKDIVRFKRSSTAKKILIHRGVTIEQAQEWCGSDYTHKPGVWFDGYATTGTYCTGQRAKYQKYFTPTATNH